MNKTQDILPEGRDYEPTGLTIQQAMLDVVRSRRTKSSSPPRIRWGERGIQTSDCIEVPERGRVRIEFLRCKPGLVQGVDIKVNGGIRLADGAEVPVLRTWHDERYEDSVEYEFRSDDGKLWLWNVYEVVHPSGQREAMKWTDNSGFWVENTGPNQKTYHCSAGSCTPPDFGVLEFLLTLL
jgi:hypothetical protein